MNVAQKSIVFTDVFTNLTVSLYYFSLLDMFRSKKWNCSDFTERRFRDFKKQMKPYLFEIIFLYSDKNQIQLVNT